MDRREREASLHFLPGQRCPESSPGQRLPSSSFHGQWSREQEGERKINSGEPTQVCTVGLEGPVGNWCVVPRGCLRALGTSLSAWHPGHEREAE